MDRWPLSHGGGGVLPVGSVPGEPVGSPAAESCRRSIPTQHTCRHRPDGGRFAWETVPDTVVNWQRTALPAALTVGVVVLVPPKLPGFFFENQ